MFPKSCNYFLKGFCSLANLKTASGEFSYCRLLSAQSKLKSANELTTNDKIDQTTLTKKKVNKLPFNSTNLSSMMLQMKSKKMRKRSNLIYFEGKRLLADALEAGIVPLQVYFSQANDIANIKLPEETALFKMPYNEMKVWTGLTTCPGVITICKKPEPLEDYSPQIPVTVLCDNVREPGNLGALIRCSAAAGAQEMILSEGCVELWEPKVIRGGMGSHFRIPIYDENSWKNIEETLDKNTLFVIASNEKANSSIHVENTLLPYYNLKYNDYQHITLLIGGETSGISENAHKLSHLYKFHHVTIPLYNGVESLNCVSALSVILFEIMRQFATNYSK